MTWLPSNAPGGGIIGLPLTIDRTALELYWSCPRRFWWARRFLAPGAAFGGLEPPESEYRIFGKAVHRMIELSTTDGDPLTKAGKVSMDLYEELKLEPEISRIEYLSLAQGMSIVWLAHVLPTLLERFEIVAVEEELKVTFANKNGEAMLTILVQPDLVLREKLTGRLIYFEWKTTAWGPDAGSTNQWDKSPQIQLGMMAIEQKYGRCDGAIVGLFYKGQKRNGVRTSPFCYGYVKGGSIRPGYTAGWQKTPVSEILLLHDMTILDWVHKFDPELYAKQFWTTGLLTPSPWVREGLERDMQGLASDVQSLDPNDYAQHWNACEPALAGPCGFLQLCHSPVGLKPLTVYQPRTPHHAGEPSWIAK